MDTKRLFNYHAYIHSLVCNNKLAYENKFKHCICTGLSGVEELLDKFQTVANFVASDDITTGETVMLSGGYFQRRTFMTFILMHYEFGNEKDRQNKLTICRELMRQFQSKFIIDEENLNNEMVYLGVGRMTTTEIGQRVLNGCTGLYFMVSVDEPIDLSYNEDEWNDGKFDLSFDETFD